MRYLFTPEYQVMGEYSSAPSPHPQQWVIVGKLSVGFKCCWVSAGKLTTLRILATCTHLFSTFWKWLHLKFMDISNHILYKCWDLPSAWCLHFHKMRILIASSLTASNCSSTRPSLLNISGRTLAALPWLAHQLHSWHQPCWVCCIQEAYVDVRYCLYPRPQHRRKCLEWPDSPPRSSTLARSFLCLQNTTQRDGVKVSRRQSCW